MDGSGSWAEFYSVSPTTPARGISSVGVFCGRLRVVIHPCGVTQGGSGVCARADTLHDALMVASFGVAAP